MTSDEQGGLLLPFSHMPPSSDNRRRWLVGLPLVVALHAVFFLFLVLGMRLSPVQRLLEKPVEISFQQEKPRPPDVLPTPKLVAPERHDVSPPPIDIIIAPQPPLSGTQGVMPSVASGGNGNGGQGIRTASAAPPRVAPQAPVDPNCETRAAYIERVRRSIQRYQSYSAAAQMLGVQGNVVLHLITDHDGKVLVSNVAGATVVRSYRGKTEGGSLVPVTVYFHRVGPTQWRYEADTLSVSQSLSAGSSGPEGPDGKPAAPVEVKATVTKGAPVVIGQGTINAAADGTLSTEGTTSGFLFLHVRQGIIASGSANVTVDLGKAGNLFMLENDTTRSLHDAEALPGMPACLKLNGLNELMPFDFNMQMARH